MVQTTDTSCDRHPFYHEKRCVYFGDKPLTLQALTFPTSSGQPPKGLFVALHGWGANYEDLASLAPYLALPDFQMVFPNAPFPHPYAPAGRMWYGLPEQFDFQSTPDFATNPQLLESRRLLLDWLPTLEETTGIPLSRTILAGFSQGGAMTLDVGMRLPLAALMVLSGYLHAPLEQVSSEMPPIFIVHGTYDPVVPLEAAQATRDSLLQVGATVDYHEYAMGHEIQPQVLKVMQSFLIQRATRWRENTEKT